ncbi:MAG: UvrD-helicase domain-containing protein [Proteobacteria bacterium]|nr:UvrD-helicase domain-containing protein [Pseudomonadota bacterium]MBU1596445.1 UvrD-helicase domain-containing protein [Pseudomonadota bacterium]
MKAAPFRQVKASAGSGKTFALTRRFLQLLGGAEEQAEGFACAGAASRPGGYSWPEILAVTFTNKAAAEMKERVLQALKLRALDLPEAADQHMTPGHADALLQDILRHAQHLGIRTIDSLLNLLVRLFALDLGMRPDFETVFDERPVMEALLDRFLARCEGGGPEGDEAEALYGQAVRTIIEHENKDGFWLQDTLRERLVELACLLKTLPGPYTTDQKRLADLLSLSYSEMQHATQGLADCLEAEELAANANFSKLLARCAGAELFGGLPESAYLEKDDLDACLLAKSRGRRSARAQNFFSAFRAACAGYVHDQAVLSPAYALAPCTAIGEGLLAGLEALQREQGFLFGNELARKVCALLDQGAGVPDAFCRLGERLHHLLVDEFQDTSRDQWSAALPLASECLAKGGSLFCVGDVKQAIYGWRGGDARLFDEVASDLELNAMSGGVRRDTLPHNWRSAPEIVAFNNRIFGALEDPAIVRDLACAQLPGAPLDIAEAFLRDLCTAFAGSRQEVPPASQGDATREPGLVQVRLLAPGRAEDIEAQSMDALVATIREQILPRRTLGDIAVLVRTAKHADLVCERLVAEGLPVITENSLLLARHPVVRQLTALFRVLDYPADDAAFFELVSGGELFLPESGLTLQAVHDWACAQARPGLLSRFRKDFPQVHARLVAPFLKRAALLRPYDLAQAALNTFQVLARHPGAELYVRRFLELIHLAESKGLGSLARFLEFWSEAGAEEKVPLPEAADAIRILTIHKAKGLQFPVTIVPLHNWSAGRLADYRPVELHGHRVLTRVTKALGRPYHQRNAALLLEQINLLYVAWTRAEEELYVFVPGTGGRSNAGPVPAILKRLLNIPAEDAGLTLGRPPAAKAEFQAHSIPELAAQPAAQTWTPPLSETPEFQAWLPRLRVFRHAVDDAAFDGRARGKLAHKAVELLRPSGDDDVDAGRAAALALEEFPELLALSGDTRQALACEVADMLRWLLSRPEVRPHLGKGSGELTILTAEGAFQRPDLLHFTPDGPVVLEFKTGQAEPEHARQVRNYLFLARQLPQALGKTPRGLLVYLDRRTTTPVDLTAQSGVRP